MAVTKKKKEEGLEQDKMLGAFVPAELFWKFKEAAASRKETMGEAMMNAAYLYLSIDKDKEADVDAGK